MLLDGSYIDGTWRTSDGDSRFLITNPTDGSPLAELRASSLQQADEAVAAAERAFPSWAALPVSDRAVFLRRIHEELSARADEIAESVTREVGSTIGLSRGVQAGAAISKFAQYADITQATAFEERYGATPVLREPIGVVACITPWNFPLLQIAAKVAPALAAGCTLVLKPSELSPTNAQILAECIHAAELPAGVFNMVWGDGPTVGERLVEHPSVDMVSFTGSTGAGRRIGAVAAQMIKRTAMELGGKSAAILADDADFEQAIAGVLETCFVNTGQSCTAHSRMIVPTHRAAEAAEITRGLVETWTVGDPFDEATRMGPVISRDHWEKVQSYIALGESDPHTTTVVGGSGKPEGLGDGNFVRPTVFAGVQPNDRLAQEEVFGPVLSILTASDDDEAVAIANNSIYGLSGGVWSADQDRALSIARRMRTGTVEVNGGAFNGDAPFGGYKQSGLGREMGPHGLLEFLELKTLQV
ncbi:MAG: aldehyde dehydrogenase family protein [Parvularculaceae bacterium]|nr:aldehyde dehydrogenase family protein [Parvularculaceae bacterium]